MSQQELICAERSDAERGPARVPMRQMRDRLVRQRATDARIVRLARRIALRRADGAVATPAVAPLGDMPATALSAPRLDAAAIGRHCRMAFPVSLADGAFEDLLSMLERAERQAGGSLAPVRAAVGAPVSGS